MIDFGSNIEISCVFLPLKSQFLIKCGTDNFDLRDVVLQNFLQETTYLTELTKLFESYESGTNSSMEDECSDLIAICHVKLKKMCQRKLKSQQSQSGVDKNERSAFTDNEWSFMKKVFQFSLDEAPLNQTFEKSPDKIAMNGSALSSPIAIDFKASEDIFKPHSQTFSAAIPPTSTFSIENCRKKRKIGQEGSSFVSSPVPMQVEDEGLHSEKRKIGNQSKSSFSSKKMDKLREVCYFLGNNAFVERLCLSIVKEPLPLNEAMFKAVVDWHNPSFGTRQGLLNFLKYDIFQAPFKRETWDEVFSQFKSHEVLKKLQDQTKSTNAGAFVKKLFPYLSEKEMIAMFISKSPDDVATIWTKTVVEGNNYMPFIHLKMNQTESNNPIESQGHNASIFNSVPPNPIYSCNLNTFFFAFDEEKPFVLNMGTQRGDKTKFLNGIFKTSFPEHSTNILHDQSVDLLVDKTGKGYHILDYHGDPTLNSDLTQFTASISSIVLFHVNLSDINLEKGSFNDCFQGKSLFDNIQICKIVLVVHIPLKPQKHNALINGSQKNSMIIEDLDSIDSPSDSEEESEEFETACRQMKSFWEKQNVGLVFYDNNKKQNERESEAFEELNNYFKKNLHEAPAHGFFDICDKISAINYQNTEIKFVDQDLRGFSKFFREKIRNAISDLEKSDFLQFSRKMKAYQKQNLTSQELECITKLKENFKLDQITTHLFITLSQKIGSDFLLYYFETCRLLQSQKEEKIGSIVSCKSLLANQVEQLNAWLEKTAGDLKDFEDMEKRAGLEQEELKKKNEIVQSIRNKAQEKEILLLELQKKNEEISPYQLGMEHMWREVIFHAEKLVHDNSFQGSSQTTLRQQDVLQTFLACIKLSIPVEIVDGDTLEIRKNFLKKVFAQLYEIHNFSVFTICGPQSSGKSFLLNHLYNCFFAVRDGRCSRGLYLTMKKTDQPECPDLFILDTEGLLSPEREEKSYTQGIFDRQITAFSLAMSDIVCFNLKGELSSSSQNVIDMSVYALHTLKTSQKKPLLLFVMRDISTTDATKQITVQKQFENIIENMKKKAKQNDIQVGDWTELQNEPSKNFLLAPSPFNQNSKKIPGCDEKKINSFCDVFTKEVRSWEYRFRNIRQTKKNNSLNDWFNYCCDFWDEVKNHEKVFHFASLEQLVQEKQIGQYIESIGSSYGEQGWNFFGSVRELLTKQIGKEKISQAECMKFQSLLNAKLRDFLAEAQKTLEDKVKILKVPPEVMSVKIEMVRSRILNDFELMKRELRTLLLDHEIQVDILKILGELEHWINTELPVISTSTVAEVGNMFSKKKSETRAILEQKIADNYNEEVLKSNIVDFFKQNADLSKSRRIDEKYICSEYNLSSWDIREEKKRKKNLLSNLTDGVSSFFGFGNGSNQNLLSSKIIQSFKKNILEHISLRANQFSDKKEFKCEDLKTEIQFLEEKLIKEEEFCKISLKIEHRTLFFNELMVQIMKKLSWSYKRTKESILNQFEERAEQIRKYALILADSKVNNNKIAELLGHELCDSWINEIKYTNSAGFSYSLKEEIRKKLPKSEILREIEISHDMSRENKKICSTQPAKYIRNVFSRLYVAISAEKTGQWIENIKLSLHKAHSQASEIAKKFESFSHQINLKQRDFDLNRESASVQDQASKKKMEDTRLSLEKDLFQLFMSAFCSNYGNFQENLAKFIEKYNSWSQDSKLTENCLKGTVPIDFKIDKDKLNHKELTACRITEPTVQFFNAFSKTIFLFDIFSTVKTIEKELRETAEIEKDVLEKEQLGCMEQCPYCHAICDHAHEHQNLQHFTKSHKIMAFGGYRRFIDQRAALEVCTTPYNFNGCICVPPLYTEVYPFPGHLKKFNPTWEIKESTFVDGGNKMKQVWKEIGKEICEEKGMIYHEDFKFE